ncbi:MAG: hypothetical protein JSV22_02980 [Bacteroidales bacterium]|nr:MAG: hypothetical protein JSV22_02980 [Bacteroidales bacterium]
MKPTALSLVLFIIFTISLSAQDNVPAVIKLKDGKTVDVYHFGQLVCNKTRYFDSYIMLKGRYENIPTEIKDYKTISKMVMIDFEDPPVASVGNEKSRITVYKRNGVVVDLVEAELQLSCYGADEKYNQIKVQILNPLTEKVVERTIDMKDIDSIIFK